MVQAGVDYWSTTVGKALFGRLRIRHPMTRRDDSKQGFRYNPFKDYRAWAIYGPFVAAVMLNAIVRPSLATRLGGELVSRGGSTRGNDRWWVFDDAIRADHHWLTGFLSLSDGLIGIGCFALIAILLSGGWLANRLKARHP